MVDASLFGRGQIMIDLELELELEFFFVKKIYVCYLFRCNMEIFQSN